MGTAAGTCVYASHSLTVDVKNLKTRTMWQPRGITSTKGASSMPLAALQLHKRSRQHKWKPCEETACDSRP